MNRNGRKSNGQFSAGNPGGPGRPARDVEREYLATLSEAVTPDRWRKIVQRAISNAEAGNHRAREWLGKYLLSDKPDVAMAVNMAETADAVAIARELRKDRDYVRFCRAKVSKSCEKRLTGSSHTPASRIRKIELHRASSTVE